MPAHVEAREARPGELGPAGEVYANMREPGISVGDVLEFTFDEVGSMPALNTSALFLTLFAFNCPLGYDGFEFTGRWISSSLLYVTITRGTWAQNGVTDPAFTRVGRLGFQLKPEGNLV